MSEILVISYYANVDGVACSHHIDDRLEALVDSGFQVTLVSARFAPRLERIRHLRFSSNSPSGFRFETRQILKAGHLSSIGKLGLQGALFLNTIPYMIERLFLRRDATAYWANPVFRGLLTACKQGRFDLIYSTGGPHSAHLASLRLARASGAPWVAEFQDPLIHDYCAKSPTELRELQQLEKDVLTHARHSIFLTEKAAHNAQVRTGIHNKAIAIYPGGAFVDTTRSTGKQIDPYERGFVLGHFGSLGGRRNLGSFLGGLKIALLREPAIGQELVVKLFGNLAVDDVSRIEASGLSGHFRMEGLLPRADSFYEMLNCKVLLLVQANHPISTETIPSKTYEYFNTGKRILGLIHENEELKKLIETRDGIAVQVDDEEAIAEALLSLHRSWKGRDLRNNLPANSFLVKDSVSEMMNLALPHGKRAG